MSLEEYKRFVSRKSHLAGDFGFKPIYTNPDETVFTPFMGVGSEVYSPVYLGRKGIGVELKASYYNQAVRNIATAKDDYISDGVGDLFAA